MSNATVPTNSVTGEGSGFLSSVGRGLGEGLSRVARDVLPIWAAQQLGVQSQDQLATRGITHIPSTQAPRIEDFAAGFRAGSQRPANLDVGNVSISPLALLAVGGVAVIALVALR